MNLGILPLGYFLRQERERLHHSLEEQHRDELKNASPDQEQRIRKIIAKQIEQKLKAMYPEEYSRYRKGYPRFIVCG